MSSAHLSIQSLETTNSSKDLLCSRMLMLLGKKEQYILKMYLRRKKDWSSALKKINKEQHLYSSLSMEDLKQKGLLLRKKSWKTVSQWTKYRIWSKKYIQGTTINLTIKRLESNNINNFVQVWKRSIHQQIHWKKNIQFPRNILYR